MFISVDLPAPFSPSRACTSPCSTSRSTWSLASTPGNCFVIPLSSRTGSALTAARFYGAENAGGRARGPPSPETGPGTGRIPSPSRSSTLQRRRRLDLAGDDLGLQRVDPRDVGLRHLRADLAEGDAAVLQVERQVDATDQRAVLRRLDGQVDALVDAFHRARQDVRTEVGLVDVDAVAPDPLLLRRLERPQPARPGDREDDVRARGDLVRRDRLALVLLGERLRVADEHLRPGNALLRPGAIASDERVDRRDLHAGGGADDVLRAVLLRHQGGETPDQVAVLLGRVRQARDVLRLDVPLLVRERRAVHGVVGDRELRVRELLRHRVLGIGEQEARADDQIEVLPGERREVGDVVPGRPRLDRLDGYAAERLGPLQAL